MKQKIEVNKFEILNLTTFDPEPDVLEDAFRKSLNDLLQKEGINLLAETKKIMAAYEGLMLPELIKEEAKRVFIEHFNIQIISGHMNYFDIFKIDPKIDLEIESFENTVKVAVKKAYRTLALRCHPDKSNSSSNSKENLTSLQKALNNEFFNVIYEAKATLSDHDRFIEYRERLFPTSELDDTSPEKFKPNSGFPPNPPNPPTPYYANRPQQYYPQDHCDNNPPQASRPGLFHTAGQQPHNTQFPSNPGTSYYSEFFQPGVEKKRKSNSDQARTMSSKKNKIENCDVLTYQKLSFIKQLVFYWFYRQDLFSSSLNDFQRFAKTDHEGKPLIAHPRFLYDALNVLHQHGFISVADPLLKFTMIKAKPKIYMPIDTYMEAFEESVKNEQFIVRTDKGSELFSLLPPPKSQNFSPSPS